MWLRGDGVDIETVLVEPPQPPSAGVVLLCGWGDTAQSLAQPAAAWAERGYLAVSISMRGFGRSGGTDDCGLRQPDDVVAVVEWVRARTERVVLMGISQGGQVALLTAARGAPVAAVSGWSAVTDVAAWRVGSTTSGIAEYIDAVCGDGDLAA